MEGEHLWGLQIRTAQKLAASKRRNMLCYNTHGYMSWKGGVWGEVFHTSGRML